MNVINFENIAPYLKNPLVLSGFVIFLLFLFFRTIIKSKFIPTITRSSGSKVINRTILYGFIISILVIVLGFSLEFIKHRNNSEIQKLNQLNQKKNEALLFIMAYNIQLLIDQDFNREIGDINEINYAINKLEIDEEVPIIKNPSYLIDNQIQVLNDIEKALLDEHGLKSKQLFVNMSKVMKRCIYFRDENIPLAISIELEQLIAQCNLPSRLKRVPINDSFVWVQDLKSYYSEIIFES